MKIFSHISQTIKCSRETKHYSKADSKKKTLVDENKTASDKEKAVIDENKTAPDKKKTRVDKNKTVPDKNKNNA